MSLEKLSRGQLTEQRGGRVNEEYVAFLRTLKPGEGGRTTVAAEGVGRQTIKARLKKAAAYLGIDIKFVRSSADEVVFQVVDE